VSANPLNGNIVIDGSLADWSSSDRIDYGDVAGYSLYERAQGGSYIFALSSVVPIGANTTFWFNTDQNTATGFQIFGFAGGAEFNVTIAADGTASLYTGGQGQTLVLSNIQVAYSADYQTIEFAVPKTAIGSPGAFDVLYDVNNSVYGPSNYSALPYVAFDSTATRTDPTQRIGIVYSQTTANNYFSPTAYAQLVMAVQSQAMQAGISFDLLTESDLKNISKLANYEALVFPSFSNIQSGDVQVITDTLLQASRQFGVGLIAAGNFMTNDQTGAPLPGDSYARMKLLLDATAVSAGFPADVTINATNAAPAVFPTLSPGELIHSYSQVGWQAFQSVSGTGQTLVTETVNGQTLSSVLATQTAAKNVLFSTPGVMADNNLLWQAIDYVAKDPGIQVSLDLTRSKGIVASRCDMDQSQYSYDVTPPNGSPGIYDLLLPILAQWKQEFNFVGSYYVNIGNDPKNEDYTDWSKSAPYYAQLLAMGNELGTHSYTHPDDTNPLTPAQIQFEFQQSAQVISQQMSAYLGTPFTVAGAAVPGAPETLATAQQIIQYFDYMTGGYSSVGAGYPGAFGFLTPDLTNKAYLAPNTSFDFSLVEYQKLGAAGAEAAWANEWNQLQANANTPIVLWPWHDYAATMFQENPGVPSLYTTQMFTNWIQRAYNSGAEFVTEQDLAARIESFYHSGVAMTIAGNILNLTVNSSHAGEFALNLSGLGSQVIANAGGWYAYDNDSLFLPETGGSYNVTLGAAADDVTHITALPMRADLLSVAGNGLDLSFSMIGDGDVTIDVGQYGGMSPVVSGASIVGMANGQLELGLTGLGRHDVSLKWALPTPAESVVSLLFSADTGVSATDFVTKTAAQTITGVLSAPLGAGNVVKVSLDNGTTWLAASATAGATSFSLAGVTLTGSNTLIARVENAAGTPGAVFTQAYVLDQQPPATPSVPDLATASDNGISNTDNLTNVALPTFSGTADAGSTLTLLDGTATIGSVLVGTDGTWSVTATAALANGAHSISAVATDLAGNASPPTASLTVTIDTTVPVAPSAPDLLAASDSGRSASDNITSVVTPSFSGTAPASSWVTLYDGATAIGNTVATAAGAWTVVSAQLSAGVHSITAKAMTAAGNYSVASAALQVTIDTVALVPSVPDMTAATDKGTSNTDNITNDNTPTFTGTAEAGAAVTLLDGATVLATANANASGVWNVVAPALSDGRHDIAARATDVAGNISTLSASLAVLIDTIAPPAPAAPVLTAASDTGVSGTDGLTNVKTPTFTGTAEAGSTVTLYNGTTKAGTGVAGADGVWTITSNSLTEGSHSMTARATDVAGNAGIASAATVVVINTKIATPSRPVLDPASDSGVSNSDRLTNVTMPTFKGTAEAGSTVTLFDGSASVGTGTASAAGTWSIVSQTLTNGVHSMSAKAVDSAGNISNASSALAVTVDTLPPGPPIVTKGSASSLGGTGEAGATVTVFNGAPPIATVTVGAAGSWNVSIAAATVPRTLTVSQTDKAGNTGPAFASQILLGTAGADTLTSAAGNDFLVGGAASDTFSFATQFGQDIIADFTAGGAAHDIINFHGNSLLNSYASVMNYTTVSGTGVVISAGGTNSITINNVTKAALTASDFTFV
jgi:serralysin